MTPAYVEPIWLVVLCPSSTHLDFLMKFVFKYHTKSSVTLLHAFGSVWPSTNISKAMPISVISFVCASLYRVFLFSLSILLAWSIFVGISMPYLCVVLRIQSFILDTMISHLCRVYGTHHAKVASLVMSIPWKTRQSWMSVIISYPLGLSEIPNGPPILLVSSNQQWYSSEID